MKRPYIGQSIEVDDEQKKEVLNDHVWFDTVQAANHLRLSIGALRNLTSNGVVKYYKLGKRRNRYLKSELDQMLLSQPKGGAYGD